MDTPATPPVLPHKDRWRRQIFHRRPAHRPARPPPAPRTPAARRRRRRRWKLAAVQRAAAGACRARRHARRNRRPKRASRAAWAGAAVEGARRILRRNAGAGARGERPRKLQRARRRLRRPCFRPLSLQSRQQATSPREVARVQRRGAPCAQLSALRACPDEARAASRDGRLLKAPPSAPRRPPASRREHTPAPSRAAHPSRRV